MTAEETFREDGTSLLLAGLMFLVRRRVESRGKDRTSRDRRIAILLSGASPAPTIVGIVLDPGTG